MASNIIESDRRNKNLNVDLSYENIIARESSLGESKFYIIQKC